MPTLADVLTKGEAWEQQPRADDGKWTTGTRRRRPSGALTVYHRGGDVTLVAGRQMWVTSYEPAGESRAFELPAGSKIGHIKDRNSKGYDAIEMTPGVYYIPDQGVLRPVARKRVMTLREVFAKAVQFVESEHPRDEDGKFSAGVGAATAEEPVGPTHDNPHNEVYVSILLSERAAATAQTPEEAAAFISDYGLGGDKEAVAGYVRAFEAKRELTDALGQPPSALGLVDYLNGANLAFIRAESKITPIGGLSESEFHAINSAFLKRWIGSSNSDEGCIVQGALNELAGLPPADGMHKNLLNDFRRITERGMDRKIDAFRRNALAYVAQQSKAYAGTTIPDDQKVQFRGVNDAYAKHIMGLGVGDQITGNPIFSVTTVPEKAYRFAGPSGVMLSFDEITGDDVFASSTIAEPSGKPSEGLDGDERETILKGGSTRAWEVVSIGTWTVASEPDRPIPENQVGKMIPHYHLRLKRG